MNAIAPLSVTALVPQDMDQAIRLAQAMASAKLVPKHLQGDAGSCLMVVEQAMRWGMSPFAVAQCTSSISGKLMFEGKLIAAAVESCGAIEGGFDYSFSGEGDARQVTVSARRRGETNPRQMTIHLRDVRTTNEWWKKQPDQMLVYSGTRNWARRWTPAAILGVYSPEEFDRQTGQIVEHAGPTIDGKADLDVPAATRREQINAEIPLEPKRMTIGQWLTEFRQRCEAAETQEEADAILKEERVLRLDDPELKISPASREMALGIRKAMVDRIWAEPPEDEEETVDADGVPA